jgi:hypothetical protein
MLSSQLFFNLNGLIVAQATPGAQGQASSIAADGAVAADAISAAMDKLWTDVLGGGLYGAIAQLGVFFAVGTLLIFLVQWFKDLMEGDNPQAFTSVIWPILVIVLLANQAKVLSACTLQLRGIINQVNQQILTSTSGSLQLQEAYQQVVGQVGASDTARSVLSQCATLADPQQQNECVQNATRQAQEINSSLPQQSNNVFQNPLDSLNPAKQIENFTTTVFAVAVRGWLIAFGIAFQWIVEISLLLTGLLGPLAVGGSLLPVGQKAIFAWLTGFFSVGMVKLSFNIICGLVATLVINAENADSMIFAFATGLLAPVLSLILAAGGGIAVFNSLSTLATSGLNGILPRLNKLI